jgi:hypothetical protein
MNTNGYFCKFCNRNFKFKDLFDQHIITCEYFYRSKRQRERDIDSNESLPTTQEQFKLIQQLTLKVAHMENEIIKLKSGSVSRKRKVIIEWLNSSNGPKPDISFQKWCRLTVVTFDHLMPVFERDISEGMRICLKDFCGQNQPIPICAFTQKPGSIYIWASEPDDDSICKWIILDAITYTKWIDRVAHHFLKTFLQWQLTNTSKIRATEQEKEQNISNMHKINGLGNSYENRRRIELRKWIFNILEQDFAHIVEYDYV